MVRRQIGVLMIIHCASRIWLAMCVFQCKTYACIMESHLMGLTIDFTMGFVCFDAASKVSSN